MISIEAYRSAIGRFYGKAKKIDKPKACLSSELARFLFKLFLLMILFLAFAYSEFFVYVTMVLVLLMAYGYCLTTCCITMDLLASSFQKAAVREKMFMTSPLQSSIVNSAVETNGYNFDSRKIYNLTIKTGYFVLSLGVILFSCKVMCELLNMNKTDVHYDNIVNHVNNALDYLQMYSLHHLKLIQLLIDGDVESNPGPVTNNCVTPKGRGRPKKVAKGFGKRKLNFDNLDANNLYGNQINLDTNNIYGNPNFLKKISVVQSDILNVRCDAIVNAAKMSLLGGGGIDKAIHRKAGIAFSLKCRALPVKSKDSNGKDIRSYW